MKSLILTFLFTFTCIFLSGQVSESRSGIKQFNISGKGIKQKEFIDKSRNPADVVPPALTLLSPVLEKDSLIVSDSRTLVVNGKVKDAGGVFAVMVNGIEAKVWADGMFLAEIPLAFGKNVIKIIATDIALNSSRLQFYSIRPTSSISSKTIKLVKPVNNFTINITQPSSSAYTTANNKLSLQACIKANIPIEKVIIYRDGSFIKGYLSNQIVQEGECTFHINQPVPLKLGMNEIRIEVFADRDTISKSINVEYSFYAARNFALIIGNENYDDPRITNLSEPVKDAAEMSNILLKKYNFDKENVLLLKNPTKSEIIGTLNKLRSLITSSDNLLIFYAGHGYWDEGMGVGYWLPKDASVSNPVNWIPNTDLTNYLGAIKSKHTLLIADACFSGGIFKTRSAFSKTYVIGMLYQLNSRKAITSGTLSEVPDKSVFFRYLLKNLEENTNEYLSSEELFSKMRMAVMNNSGNVPQFGTIQNVGDEGGDFIFIRRKQ